MSLRAALVALAVTTVCPGAVRAQAVMGRVVDSASRRPVGKLTVRLVPASDSLRDTTYAAGETAADGVFLLMAPKPGTYRVRLGATHVTLPITLANADAEDQHEYVVGPDAPPAPAAPGAPGAPAGPPTTPGAPPAPGTPTTTPAAPPAPGAPSTPRPATPPTGALRR